MEFFFGCKPSIIRSQLRALWDLKWAAALPKSFNAAACLRLDSNQDFG